MAARCDDPNCSCRSPDLERFTNQVLRRDAARTDYLVIPLIGGVLANCYLAEEAIDGPACDVSPDLLDLSRSIRDLAAAARDGKSWEDETHAYGIIASLVFCNWPELLIWGSVSWHRARLDIGWKPRASRDLAAAVRVLGADPPPSWTESVILAAFAASLAGSGTNRDFHLLGKVGRSLRVVLADRMRRANLTNWPAALGAAIEDWTVPTLQQLARSQARAGDAAIHYVADLEDETKAQIEADAETSVAAPQPEPAPPPRDTGESQAAEELIKDAVVEITHWRTQHGRAQQERDRFADRDARHRSHIESLERELQSSRSAQTRLETQVAALRQERDLFAERIAAYESVAEDAPSSLPATDTFAGRRVLVFTGAENADARAAFAESFRDLGASQVDCYWADRSRGPDVFPADTIVAVDVSFMSHSTWNAIQDRARAAGAWCYWGKHGAATLSRATAAAWMAHQARR
ncbi:MAG TPA: hypothetical protein VGH98_05895 [Gemmatimonadaceae bacterium]